jgi:hypothetical protein
MVADQNGGAVFRERRATVDSETMPDHAVRPVDELKNLQKAVDFGFQLAAQPGPEGLWKQQHACCQKDQDADTHE